MHELRYVSCSSLVSLTVRLFIGLEETLTRGWVNMTVEVERSRVVGTALHELGSTMLESLSGGLRGDVSLTTAT
jgi:hypothetical protein